MIEFVELYSSTKEEDLETDFKKIMHRLKSSFPINISTMNMDPQLWLR